MNAVLSNPSPALSSLRRRWLVYALSCSALLAAGYALFSAYWPAAHAGRWLFFACLAMLYPLAVLWRGLELNYRAGEGRLLSTLGAGNALTLLRGALVAALAGFLFVPRPEGWLVWVPAVLYTLADAADYFDGYLARRTRHATRLGENLDMSFDGWGVLAATLLALQWDQLPPWYLLVAVARYLFVAGQWLRRRLGKPVYDLPPSSSRRTLAGLQMGFLAAALWPVFGPPVTYIAAALFGLPFLAGFGRDWLITSGAVRPSPERGRQPSSPEPSP